MTTLPKDEQQVIAEGDTLAIDCSDSLLMSRTKQLIAGVGLQGDDRGRHRRCHSRYPQR